MYTDITQEIMFKSLEIVSLNPMDQSQERDRKTGENFTLRVNNYAIATTRLIVVILTNRIWLSVVCTLIDNDTHHHSGQKVVDSRDADVRANIFQWIDIVKCYCRQMSYLCVKRKKKVGSPTSFQKKSV